MTPDRLPIDTANLPESYSELRRELEWYAGQTRRGNIGFVDVSLALADKKDDTDSDRGPFEQIYAKFIENFDRIDERLEDREMAVAKRALRLMVALEDRQEETHHLRKYKNNNPPKKGDSFYALGRVRGEADLAVYRLTEKSVAVWSRQRHYHGMFAYGSGTFDVAFPRDHEAWINKHYDSYLTASEVREIKAKNTSSKGEA